MKDVGFTGFVKPTLDEAARTRDRKARELSRIHPAWGAGWEKVIESNNYHVSILSQNYLYHMAYLARNGIGLRDATQLLHCARDKRLSNPQRGISTSTIVTVGDAQKVTDAIKRLSKFRNISPSQCTIEDLLSSLQIAVQGAIIPRITELESPVATPVSHLPTGLLPPTFVASLSRYRPRSTSLKKLKKKTRNIYYLHLPPISVNSCPEHTSLVEHTKLRRCTSV